MIHLPQRNKIILIENIRRHKMKNFPGKGSGIRLAEEIGVTPQTISNWLNGSRLPTMSQMYCLAKAFDVSPLELCGMRKKYSEHPKTEHISILIKLLRRCEKDILQNVNPRIIHKFLLEIKDLIKNELCT